MLNRLLAQPWQNTGLGLTFIVYLQGVLQSVSKNFLKRLLFCKVLVTIKGCQEKGYLSLYLQLCLTLKSFSTLQFSSMRIALLALFIFEYTTLIYLNFVNKEPFTL